MKKFYCDICGEEAGDKYGKVVVTQSGGIPKSFTEVCPDCRIKINKFINRLIEEATND